MKRRRLWMIGALGLVLLVASIWLCFPTSTKDLHQARANHGAVLLPNGQVLVTGGINYYSPIIDRDGAFGNWVRGTWLQPIWQSDLQFLWGTVQFLYSCELFDPKTGRWTIAAPLNCGALSIPTAAPSLLPDGTVLGSGGQLYKDGHWTQTGYPGEPMYEMILLPNGDVLGFAGNGTLGSIYDFKTRTWTKSKVPDGYLLALGNGLVLSAAYNGCWLYDPSKNVFRKTADMLPTSQEFSLIALADGSGLAIGEAYRDTFKGCEVFDPKTETWKRTGDLIHAREQDELVSVRLHDGRVLVMGGVDVPPAPVADETSCELYDPTTGHWSETGSMVQDRYGFTATVLQDGQVLVVGGGTLRKNELISLSSCELYDPKTGTWSRL